MSFWNCASPFKPPNPSHYGYAADGVTPKAPQALLSMICIGIGSQPDTVSGREVLQSVAAMALQAGASVKDRQHIGKRHKAKQAKAATSPVRLFLDSDVMPALITHVWQVEYTIIDTNHDERLVLAVGEDINDKVIVLFVFTSNHQTRQNEYSIKMVSSSKSLRPPHTSAALVY